MISYISPHHLVLSAIPKNFSKFFLDLTVELLDVNVNSKRETPVRPDLFRSDTKVSCDMLVEHRWKIYCTNSNPGSLVQWFFHSSWTSTSARWQWRRSMRPRSTPSSHSCQALAATSRSTSASPSSRSSRLPSSSSDFASGESPKRQSEPRLID